MSPKPGAPLVSPFKNVPFTNRKFVPTCWDNPRHRPPTPGCACGVYFLPTMRDAVERVLQNLDYQDWGDTINDGRGWNPDLRASAVITRVGTSPEWQLDPSHDTGDVFRTGWTWLQKVWVPHDLAHYADRITEYYSSRTLSSTPVIVHVGPPLDTPAEAVPGTAMRAWLYSLVPDADPERKGCVHCSTPTFPVCDRHIAGYKHLLGLVRRAEELSRRQAKATTG